jgi:hypothetical protein
MPPIDRCAPRDIIAAPRSYAEHFVNGQDFVEHESGGHFAAWERPDDYTADLRRAVELSNPKPEQANKNALDEQIKP